MNREYKPFLEILRSVSRYAVDMTFLEKNTDNARRPFQISQEEFFSKLYEERKEENDLRDFLRNSADLICLVGPKGAGKTTLGLKIAKELADSVIHKSFIVFIDIRTETSLADLVTYSEPGFRKYLREKIISKYMYRLFRYENRPDGDNPLVRLWTFLLQRHPDLPTNIFENLWRLKEKIDRLLAANQKASGGNQYANDLYDWLLAAHNTDAELKLLTEKLNKSISIPQLVYAARHIYGYDRQFIWLDNIDALPETMQSEAVSIIKGVHGLASDFVATVVAVREENVFNKYEAEHSAPPHFSTVLVGDEGLGELRANPGHPALRLPVVKRWELKNIIQKRLDFAKTFQQVKLQQVYSEIDHEKTKLKNTVNQNERRLIDRRIEEMELELQYYGPRISERRFGFLLNLSKNVLNVLYQERAIYLANNSIREFLMIHRDFLADLFENENTDKELLEATKYDRRRLSTLFFRWIFSSRKSLQIGIYDIVAATELWYQQNRKPIGCILPHLIITSIWNLTLEKLEWVQGKQRYKNPSVKEMVERLSYLGISREDTVACIYSLYNQRESRGHVIEIRSRKFLDSAAEIKDHHIVYVTYRGKCFVGLTCNTFGYLYECIKNLQSGLGSDSNAENLKNQSGFNQVKEILPYLCDIAQMHYIGLKNIRDSWPQSEDWLVDYYSKFGIPQIVPYRRKLIVGMQVKGIRRTLQFEALIAGIISYFREDASAAELKRLENFYQQVLERLRFFRDDEEIDFRKMFNLPPREDNPPALTQE